LLESGKDVLEEYETRNSLIYRYHEIRVTDANFEFFLKKGKNKMTSKILLKNSTNYKSST